MNSRAALMNADRAVGFRCGVETSRPLRAYLAATISAGTQTMAVFSIRLIATLTATLMAAGAACASQGPGTTTGAASAAVQMAMATLVYGLCGAIVAAGLIGLMCRR
jgi:hypothetical protein